MAKYIIKRFIYSLITIWVIITITFFMMHLMPGNPFSNVGSKRLPPEVVKNIEAKYHTDRPLSVQYVLYLKGVVTKFDLGESLTENRSVNEVIAEHFPASAQIGVEATILATVFGLFLGIYAALKKNSIGDYIISIITMLGISLPAYVIALALQYYLAFTWNLFPISGWDGFQYSVLPSVSIALPMMVTIVKFMRSSMLDVIGQDYIKTAKAKGISSSAVVWRHIIRNAILPVVTILGPMLAGVIMGTFIIEGIFSIPGIGAYFVNCITSQDYTMIMGTTIFFSVFLVFTNFFVDLLYGIIDPRIRIS